MNVTVNDVGPCKKLVRVEAPASRVEEALAEVEREYQKHAVLPGFRKGKAPAAMIKKAFDKEITEEAQRKLISDTFKEALKEQNLALFRLLNVEEVDFGRGKPLQYVATIEVQPVFELPNYRGLPAKREARTVTEEDIDNAIELLRARGASFNTVARAAKAGDIVVVDYEGKTDDKPIAEVAPANRGLASKKDFWIELRPGAFIPGFAEQLEGVSAGDRKTVTVDFPADFVSPALAGKKGVYEVVVKEVKERVLPEVNDAFAQIWEAQDVKGLREGVRQDLQNELNDKIRRSIREQVVRGLLDPMNFDLPESAVLAETRNIVYELVKENQDRGVSKEVIEKNKDEIYSLASQAARGRVKGAFVFAKIAEKEGIKVEPAEFHARVFAMARSMKMTPEKLLEELKKRDGMAQIAEQILNEKVIDFLQENARIEDVAPAASA